MNLSIVGTWRLVRSEAVDSDGNPQPSPYGGDQGMGLVTFNAAGRMMAVLCDGRATLPAGVVREYNSYCGNYTFDGKQLITKVDACAAASTIQLGSNQVREVSTEGKLMVLRPPKTATGERVVQRTLYWEKISDV